MAVRKSRKPREQSIQVRAHWTDAETKDIVFANQIFVRYTGSAYLITFGQTHGPYELKASREQLQSEGVPVHAVARIAVTPDNLKQFMVALQDIYERMSNNKRTR